MSESKKIQWGREIAIHINKPEWLADDQVCMVRTNGGWYGEDDASTAGEWWFDHSLDAIRLPADHWAYLALDKGFEPWGGGDSAPDDWDGGEILSRSGTKHSSLSIVSWAHPWEEHLAIDGKNSADIIGYRKRAETVASQQSGGTVTIKQMTFDQWCNTIPRADMRTLSRLNLIREESRTEKFARETGHEITPAVEAALNWSAS